MPVDHPSATSRTFPVPPEQVVASYPCVERENGRLTLIEYDTPLPDGTVCFWSSNYVDSLNFVNDEGPAPAHVEVCPDLTRRPEGGTVVSMRVRHHLVDHGTEFGCNVHGGWRVRRTTHEPTDGLEEAALLDAMRRCLVASRQRQREEGSPLVTSDD